MEIVMLEKRNADNVIGLRLGVSEITRCLLLGANSVRGALAARRLIALLELSIYNDILERNTDVVVSRQQGERLLSSPSNGNFRITGEQCTLCWGN